MSSRKEILDKIKNDEKLNSAEQAELLHLFLTVQEDIEIRHAVQKYFNLPLKRTGDE